MKVIPVEKIMLSRSAELEVTENPYMARQLSVFDDRQLITGLPGMMLEGLWHTQNPTVNAKR